VIDFIEKGEAIAKACVEALAQRLRKTEVWA
jgi:hypothetical protein